MSDQSARASRRRRILLAIEVVVSIALLTFLFSRVDMAALWDGARRASVVWLAVALGLYFINVVASAWRWQLLLRAQGVQVPSRTLLSSYLVAGFFNNFLPSTIGGDVVRIRDTARPAQSKTLATTVVFVDRALGLMGLVLVRKLLKKPATRYDDRSVRDGTCTPWALSSSCHRHALATTLTK